MEGTAPAVIKAAVLPGTLADSVREAFKKGRGGFPLCLATRSDNTVLSPALVFWRSLGERVTITRVPPGGVTGRDHLEISGCS